VGIEMNKMPSAKRIREVKAVYDRGDTLKEAGKKLNISGERVRQILIKGLQRGLFEYSSKKKRSERSAKERAEAKQKILEEYTRIVKSLGYHPQQAELIKLSDRRLINSRIRMYFGSIFTLRGLFPDYPTRPTRPTLEQRKQKCIEDYNQLVDELGHHPFLEEMWKEKEGLGLSMRIYRIWGGIIAFRKEQGINRL